MREDRRKDWKRKFVETEKQIEETKRETENLRRKVEKYVKLEAT
jgi:hypothetical protein